MTCRMFDMEANHRVNERESGPRRQPEIRHEGKRYSRPSAQKASNCAGGESNTVPEEQPFPTSLCSEQISNIDICLLKVK